MFEIYQDIFLLMSIRVLQENGIKKWKMTYFFTFLNLNKLYVSRLHRKKGHSCFENIFSFNMEILK